MIYQEIDKQEESTDQYDRFVNLYIQLYYEPLVEEYDEMKYFTRNHDMKFGKMIERQCGDGGSRPKMGITSISLKN